MRRTREDAEKTRVQILDEAIDIFSRKGYSDTTLDEVAQRAGVTKGAIYWHFEDKLDLFRQVSRRESSGLGSLLDHIYEEDISPLRKIRKLTGTVVNNFYDNTRFRKFIELTWYRLSNERFEEEMRLKADFVSGFIGKLEVLFTQAIKLGEIKDGTDCELAAFHVASLINGVYRLYFVDPAHSHSKQKARRLFDNYLDSIAEDPRSGQKR